MSFTGNQIVFWSDLGCFQLDRNASHIGAIQSRVFHPLPKREVMAQRFSNAETEVTSVAIHEASGNPPIAAMSVN